MTNMTPQRPALNRGPWKYLETYERKLVTDEGKEIEVIAGPIFSDRVKKIGKGVAVPSSYFKIAVVHDKDHDVTAKSDVIAVIMPNSTTVADTKWTKFLVTPKDIEQATGCEFFTNLRPDVRAALLDKKADIQIDTLGASPQ
jgi:endonuclease G